MSTQYVVNPATGRPISVLGRVYRKLVAEGAFEPAHIEHPDILSDSDSEEKMDYYNRRLPETKQAVRGRGMFKGKIVSRNIPRKWVKEEEESDYY